MIDFHPTKKYIRDLNSIDQRVFVVGDIHGKYDLLIRALKENDIRSDDLVFFLGDLINKGNQSREVLDFVLDRDNTVCLYGNHESSFLLMVRELIKRDLHKYSEEENCSVLNNYINDMSAFWLQGMSFQEIFNYAEKIKSSFYFAAELIVGSEKIGLVHASVPNYDWKDLMTFQERSIWSFDNYNDDNIVDIKNIDMVIHGHVPVKDVTKKANAVYIDTASYRGSDEKRLSFIRIA